MKKSPYVARFDSSWSAMMALAKCLHGEDFAGLGIFPSSRPVEWMADNLGMHTRRVVYALGGRMEALSEDALKDVSTEEIFEAVVEQYPQQRYPAVMVGSSNGAATHLGALMGVPWLPQNFLLPVSQSGIEPDDPGEDMERGIRMAPALLQANPDLQLHHMHDPINDRLMIQYFSYFRIKSISLNKAARTFIEERLEPGGTIFTLECGQKWPVTTINDRHFFQVGGVGGVTPEEYINGGPRIEKFLQEHGSRLTRWNSPKPDTVKPEAEWGFEPRLLADIENLAKEKGYKVKRLLFEDSEDLSPLVADIYRWWYRQSAVTPAGLIVEPFILLEPLLTMRERLIPFWIVFNALPSVDNVRKYLDGVEPFSNIHVALFSHGVDSIGLSSTSDWQDILDRATEKGDFLAADASKYPADFATFISFNRKLKELLSDKGPLPLLPVERLVSYMEENGHKYDTVHLV